MASDARPGDPPRLRSSLRRLVTLGPVARNVGIVAGGTAFGQLLVVGSSPIISRLYAPADLGLLAVYASVVSLSQSVVSLRYDLAIQVPKDQREAARLLIAALATSIVTTLGITLLLWLARNQLAHAAGTPRLVSYILLVPIGIVGAAWYQALTSWTVRARRYSILARTRVTQQFGLVLTQVTLGFLRFAPSGLLVGDVVGRVGGSGSLISSAWQADRACFRNVSIMRVMATARRFARFALITSTSSMVNGVGLFGPALLFSALFGPATAGQVALSQRVIALPLTLAGQSVAQVYLGEVSRLAHEMPRALPALIRSTVRRLALVALLPALALIVAGPWMFALVFGDRWRVAGTYAQILAVAFAFQMVAAPISQTLNVLGRPRLQLAWDIGRSFLVLGGIWGAWRVGLSPIATMGVYSVAMVVAYASMVGIVFGVALRAASREELVRRA